MAFVTDKAELKPGLVLFRRGGPGRALSLVMMR